VHGEPRQLLKKAGYELTEMFESDMCCGMGGSYSMKLPEISAPILRKKLGNIRETGATLVAMDCPGCVMQIDEVLIRTDSRSSSKNRRKCLKSLSIES